jgi:hypothetical protein
MAGPSGLFYVIAYTNPFVDGGQALREKLGEEQGNPNLMELPRWFRDWSNHPLASLSTYLFRAKSNCPRTS